MLSAEAIEYLKSKDRVLAKIIEKVGPVTREKKKRTSPFQALLRSIVYQQLTGKAAATIHSRVVALFAAEELERPESYLLRTEAQYRAAGLSRGKYLAIQDLALKTIDGLVPDLKTISRMENEEIIERLTAIRGIGPWTVEMLLMFHLGRPDVFPVTDYGVRKGFALAYKKKELPAPKELMKFGEKWKPFRSTASWYLWRAVDLHNEAKKSTKEKSKERK